MGLVFRPGLVDSVVLLRPRLLLTQTPNPSIDPTDTVRIVPQVSLAGAAVADIAKASQIVTAAGGDTLKVTPAGSGVRSLEIAGVLALWRIQNATETPRAIIL